MIDYADIRDRTNLVGKVALVTGGASGMGATHVHALAARGASVVLTDVNEGSGRVVAAQAAEAGANVIFLEGDVRSSRDWATWHDAVVERFGALHVLINNAGVFGEESVLTIGHEAWRRVVDINLKGPFLGAKAFAPLMRDSGGGVIINVSSAAGLDINPDPSYTASKWGVRGLSKMAAQEFGPWGIRVNSIHPGYMLTPMAEFAPDTMRRAKIALTPMQRAGFDWEASELVAFLASDAAAFITGAEIAIDGGWTSGSQATEARRLR